MDFVDRLGWRICGSKLHGNRNQVITVYSNGFSRNPLGLKSQLNLQHRNQTNSQQQYPLVIKHGNGKSPMNGGVNRKITYFYYKFLWTIFPQTMFDYRRIILLPESRNPISSLTLGPASFAQSKGHRPSG